MNDELKTGKRVLVVDDEPDFAELLSSILVNAGYTVTMAHNCEDAIAQVRKSRPDVITLDIQMPRKSGPLFYRTLRAQERFRDIPVVVVTGLMHDREMENLFRTLLEADNVPPPAAYLEKPVDGLTLLKTIEEAMSTSSSTTW